MNNKRFKTNKFLNSVAVVTALGFLVVTPCRAQREPELSERFTHAALQALHAIEADESSAPNVQTSTTPETLSSAQSVAATDAEQRFLAILYQMYRMRERDNDVIAAYRRVIEVENFSDDSESRQIREKKDYAVSQLTDTLTEIQNREDRCFRQLEKSLNQGSSRGPSGCPVLIQ
jgi:hypothetical protein